MMRGQGASIGQLSDQLRPVGEAGTEGTEGAVAGDEGEAGGKGLRGDEHVHGAGGRPRFQEAEERSR
jgi:hypothetical protein